MTVTAKLTQLISVGDLTEDVVQLRAAQALDNLLGRLETAQAKPSFFSRKVTPPKGLYLWGGVGRGKSMLMDWFFEAADTSKKQRVHFHAFMLDVHSRISAHRKTKEGDPIQAVAKDIAKKTELLCFDEFHVTDITDAMILSRLFEALWKRGLVVVATSNREPEGLYHNGLNRQLFQPFINMMPEHLIIHEFSGDTDHRLRQLKSAPVFYSPLGKQAEEGVETAWQRLIGVDVPRETTLTVQGRELALKQTAAGVARTSFDRLCNNNLGPADYITLSHAFQTLILENVPILGKHNRNEAKRFVTLIDALYETRTKLVMSAAGEPTQLYLEGDGAFEFERTASRLIEMRSHEYLEEPQVMGES